MNTDKVDSLKIGISGSWGTAYIDWGNGTTINTDDLWSLPIYFKNNYSDKKKHTITINGSKLNTIKGLFCFDNQITSLNVSNITKLKTLDVLKNRLKKIDVSNNPELSELNCTWNQLENLDISKNTLIVNLSCENNQLKSLDVSNNTKLMSVFLRSNQLNDMQLNLFFETLHNNKIFAKTIFIGGNPGIEKCDISIATKKGWVVDTESVEFE